MTKEEFIKELEWYFSSSNKRSEKECSIIVQGWEETFPNAGTADLIFWPFSDLSYEQIVSEVFAREALWQKGGDQIVQDRIRRQAEAALACNNTPKYGRKSATLYLESIGKKTPGTAG